MAKLIFKGSGKERETKDESGIKEACEESGVFFGCQEGYCGTCIIEIGNGKENLHEKNMEEIDVTGNDPEKRLACQCKIKAGNVEIINY